MFPKALPYTAFVARPANYVERFLFRQCSRKPIFDQPPARREIMVAGRQAPDGVQMIGKYDECVDRKSAALTNRGDSFAQDLYVIDEQGSAAVQQIDRKEPTPAWDKSPTIVRHEVQDSTIRDRCTHSGGLRFANPPYEADGLMILELVFLVDLAVAFEPARHRFFAAAERSRRIRIT
jgi:hypothetical protein